MLVKKRDERIETFHRQKIFHGLERAEKNLYGELSKKRKEVLEEVGSEPNYEAALSEIKKLQER